MIPGLFFTTGILYSYQSNDATKATLPSLKTKEAFEKEYIREEKQAGRNM